MILHTIRLFITDDHQVFIDGLQAILSQVADFAVVGTAQNGADTIEALKKHRCDVLLLDVEMPSMSGLETAQMLKDLNIDVRILGLTMHNEREFILQLLRAGASGYLLKNVGKQELYFSREVASTMLYDFLEPQLSTHDGGGGSDTLRSEKKLTQRESEITRMVAQGMSNVEIAAKLYLSIRTVETHRRNIMRKLDLKNIAQLVNYAREQGLV
jgi:two-component system, NarL family, nitrate/nitrite response regulator NarL